MGSRVLASTSAAGGRGRLLAMLSVAAFIVAFGSGNSFALHVGMDGAADRLSVGHAVDVRAGAGAISPGTSGSMSRPLVQDVVPGSARVAERMVAALPINHDAQHLMHLLGSCVAVLVAVGMVAWLVTWWRRCLSEPRLLTAGGQVTMAPVAPYAWRSPPLKPPTSSPVIRT